MERRKDWFLVILVVLFGSVQGCDGGVVQGKYRGTETWMYLDRFVFRPTSDEEDRGRLEATLDFAVGSAVYPALMLFYKGDESANTGVQREFGFWERVHNQDLTCEERARIAQQAGGIYIKLPGTRPVKTYVDEEGVERWSVKVITNMQTSRARWMFITVGNCEPLCQKSYCANSLDLKYHLNLTNGFGPDMYFSADKQWFLETALAFAVLYCLLVVYTLYTRRLLQKIDKYHHSVKLLVISILLSTLSNLALAGAYSSFSSTGIEIAWVQNTSTILALCAEFFLLLMVILVGKGWTIVRHKISGTGRIRIASYMTLYVVVSISCWLYYIYFVDPADIVYIYSTVPGMVLVVFRIFVFVWFSYAVLVTLRKYQQKKGFYKKYWAFVSCWILTIPGLVVVNSLVDPWFRAKVVNLLGILSTFTCQFFLILLYNPRSICGWAESFPFHATTTNDHIKRALEGGFKASGGGSHIHGSSSFQAAHVQRAFQLSSQVRHSVVMIQAYANDLHTYLENIRADYITPEGKPQKDLERGLLDKHRPSSSSKTVQPEGLSDDSALGKALSAATKKKPIQKQQQQLNEAQKTEEEKEDEAEKAPIKRRLSGKGSKRRISSNRKLSFPSALDDDDDADL